MHYHAEIWIPDTNNNVETEIEKILAPYNETNRCRDENCEGDCEHCSNTFWDWWQIGGRWTGTHDGYDPEKDPQNIENCRFHKGTNCPHCKGTGKAVKWPTAWPFHQGDVVPIGEVKDTVTCHTLILGEKIYMVERWTGKAFEKTDFDGKVKPMLAKLGVTNGFLVTVDYHS